MVTYIIAPISVSSLVHSSTLVKLAGIYLLILRYVALSDLKYKNFIIYTLDPIASVLNRKKSTQNKKRNEQNKKRKREREKKKKTTPQKETSPRPELRRKNESNGGTRASPVITYEFHVITRANSGGSWPRIFSPAKRKQQPDKEEKRERENERSSKRRKRRGKTERNDTRDTREGEGRLECFEEARERDKEEREGCKGRGRAEGRWRRETVAVGGWWFTRLAWKVGRKEGSNCLGSFP